MATNRFFKKKDIFKIKELFQDFAGSNNSTIENINNLYDADKDEITFLGSHLRKFKNDLQLSDAIKRGIELIENSN